MKTLLRESGVNIGISGPSGRGNPRAWFSRLPSRMGRREGQLLGQQHLDTLPLNSELGSAFLDQGKASLWRCWIGTAPKASPKQCLGRNWLHGPHPLGSELGASVAMVTRWGKSSGKSAAVFLALGNDMEQLERKVRGSQGPQGPGVEFRSRARLGEGAQDGQHLQVSGNYPWEEQGMRRICSMER